MLPTPNAVLGSADLGHTRQPLDGHTLEGT
jgi:hypothetical protein